MVAHLSSTLEWLQYSETPNCHTSRSGFYAKTDTLGCAAVFGVHWVLWQQWYKIAIMAREFVPIIFTCIVWGRCFFQTPH